MSLGDFLPAYRRTGLALAAWAAVGAGVCTPGLAWAAPAAAPASRPAAASTPAALPAGWKASADGRWVMDERSGLAWARCVVGMEWNGSTCAGQPRLLERGEAQALAAERAQADGLGWRLPRVVELQRLVDKTARPSGPPAAVFPAAPRDWYWSGTAQVHQTRDNPYAYDNAVQQRQGGGGARVLAGMGWAVDMATAEARGDVAKTSRLPVRLVHTPVPPARD